MKKQRIIRVAAVLAVAGATGFVMQSQDKGRPQPVVAAVIAPEATPVAVAEPAPQPVPVAEVTPPVVSSPAPEPAALPAVAEAPACSDDMALIAQPGAMLDLGLLAACRPDQRVMLRHGGLVVTLRTSSAGTLIGSIPALTNPAEVTLAFADGSSVSQSVAVPDLAQFDRFGVQWMAEDAFQLHAFERRTGTEAFGDTTSKPSAEGGFLTRLGDATADRPLLAEVYTFPAGLRALSGDVALNVESAVTATTCGREVLGETLQLTGGRLTLRDLTIEMPGCDAIGEYVVLPNPVAAEKLASN
ncbi:hypothetical protein [Gemmobacter nectariphilus]|uniref:hypothetical protein n=1 Tax=Gemmobacter nectariphilus TaxID=220343 RepID=UPI0003FE20BB|nr:hypothetical protein [Gemmobacter nectariphilus]